MIAIAMRLKRGSTLVYNSAFVLVALGLFELYLRFSPPASGHEITYSEIGQHGDAHPTSPYVQDSDFGYSFLPKKRVVREILRSPEGSIVYNVTYSTDEHGLRQGPPHSVTAAPEDNDNPIFFFVDSMVFGEGVNDDDTLPQWFSRLSGIRVINFGVPGYGPHQMLRALEIDRPRMIERRDPRAIVYILLATPHIWRATGHAKWDYNGPHYEVVGGMAKYMGPFAPRDLLLNRIFSHSRIYIDLVDEWLERVVTDADRQRLMAIVLRARDLSLKNYHAPFVVVLWDVHLGNDDGVNAQWIAQTLEQNGIPTLRLSASLPALQSDSYYNPPRDGHPIGQAHALVANALKSFLESNFPGSLADASHN